MALPANWELAEDPHVVGDGGVELGALPSAYEELGENSVRTPFDDNAERRNLSIPVKLSPNEAACRKAALDYFDLRYAALLSPSPYGMGPTREIKDKLYHGNRTQEFIVYQTCKKVDQPKKNTST